MLIFPRRRPPKLSPAPELDPPPLSEVPGWRALPELPEKMQFSDVPVLFRELWRRSVALERRVADLEKK